MRASISSTSRVAIFLIAALFVLWPAAARAAVTCSSVGTSVNITLAASDSVTISRDPSGAFSVSGTGLTPTSCGGATVVNRDAVNVTGAGGNESVTIDLSEGGLTPGATDEPGTTDEIEFAVALGAGTDTLAITGLPTDDVIAVGELGINLNDGDDLDVTTTGVQIRTITGGSGNDGLSAAGGNATGSAASFPVTLNGGADDDSMVGGDGPDTLNGDTDADLIVGGGGSDTLAGGSGNDVIDEGSQPSGADTIGGGTGADEVTYAARSADLVVTIDAISDDGESGRATASRPTSRM